MRREKKRVIKTFVIVIFLIGISVVGLWEYASYQRTVLHSYVEHLSSGGYKTNAFYVEIVTEKSWQDEGDIGAQYDGYFYNNIKTNIVNWRIDFVVPKDSYIDSDWNGVYKKNDDHISITAVDYNKIVSKAKCETFGLVIHTSNKFQVNEITVSGYLNCEITDFPIFWVLMIFLFVVMIVFAAYMFFDFRMKKMQLKQEEYKSIIMQSLKTFANIIDAKDPYTKGHSLRVAKYAQEISRRMGKSTEEQERIFQISLLHDIGKIAIDNSILRKPGKLTPEERRKVEMHAAIGGDILRDFTAIPGIEDGARFHHEAFDGSGYPTGLSGKSIPECARIICVADTFDTMDSDRCYRKRLSRDDIFKELERCANTQHDGDISKYMLEMITDGYVANENM